MGVSMESILLNPRVESRMNAVLASGKKMQNDFLKTKEVLAKLTEPLPAVHLLIVKSKQDNGRLHFTAFLLPAPQSGSLPLNYPLYKLLNLSSSQITNSMVGQKLFEPSDFYSSDSAVRPRKVTKQPSEYQTLSLVQQTGLKDKVSNLVMNDLSNQGVQTVQFTPRPAKEGDVASIHEVIISTFCSESNRHDQFYRSMASLYAQMGDGLSLEHVLNYLNA